MTEGLETMYSTLHPKGNKDLDLFLMEIGILEKKTDLEDLEDVLSQPLWGENPQQSCYDPRYICLQKGYYRTPYNENGEVMF